ncbi:MAG: biosynthetic peptidoglycan transglycosylase, partial [Lautropia mirabilis]
MVSGRWAAGLLLGLGMASAAAVSVGAEPDRTLPDFETVRSSFRSSETLLLDRHGEVLHRLRTDFQVRRGAWVALGDTSPALRMALLLSEDRRFHEHSGVDWWAVSAAAWGNLWHERTRGASTLTMQLAGLLDPALQRPASTARGLSQKWAQASAARELETRWRKDQILEAYLNLVPFRGEIVGIDALSHT